MNKCVKDKIDRYISSYDRVMIISDDESRVFTDFLFKTIKRRNDIEAENYNTKHINRVKNYSFDVYGLDECDNIELHKNNAHIFFIIRVNKELLSVNSLSGIHIKKYQ